MVCADGRVIGLECKAVGKGADKFGGFAGETRRAPDIACVSAEG